MHYNRNTKKIIAALSTAILVIFSVLLIQYSQLLSLWQLDFSNNLYGKLEPSNDIVVVGIDNRTIENLGWPDNWSRGIYARMLDNLNQYDPEVVAFDIVFLNERDEEGDNKFAESIQKTKKVVLGLRRNINESLSGDSDYVRNVHYSQDKFRDFEHVSDGNLTSSLSKDNALRSQKIYFDDQDGNTYESFAGAVVRAFSDEAASKLDKMLGEDKKSLLINFFSVPSEKAYNYYSFYDVYSDKFTGADPDKAISGKIVLVGAFTDLMKDSFLTPVDKDQPMPGVEIHANAIQTILDGKFLRDISSWEDLLVILVTVFASAFIFMFTKIRWSVLFLAAVSIGYALLAPIIFNMGVIVDLVHPYLALFSTFVVIYIYRYLTEFREKSELKGAFSKYVNPTVVNEILAHPEKLKLGGEKREVTVLFTDIEGFTSVSERLKPESLVALLNEYLEVMSNIVMEQGGTVDKFEGDAILVFFGAPLPMENHAEKACKTVLKMRKALALLLEKWKSDPPLPGGEKKPSINFRAGVSSGEVIVGNIGSAKKLEYTVIGDSVNLGARLESANKKYSTRAMISEATYEKVKDSYETREIDTIRVVGKKIPIKVYELLNEKGKMVDEAKKLISLYNEGIELYHKRKFEDGMRKFDQILKIYPTDTPSKIYHQRCEVLRNFPPKEDWDGVFDMSSK